MAKLFDLLVYYSTSQVLQQLSPLPQKGTCFAVDFSKRNRGIEMLRNGKIKDNRNWPGSHVGKGWVVVCPYEMEFSAFTQTIMILDQLVLQSFSQCWDISHLTLFS